jgi:hypothetical protein
MGACRGTGKQSCTSDCSPATYVLTETTPTMASAFAEVGVRRSNLPTQRGVLERSGSSVDMLIHNYRWLRVWPKANRNTTTWEKRLALGPTIAVPTFAFEDDDKGASHSGPPPTPEKSPVVVKAGSSPVVSGTICRKKRRGTLPKQYSTSTVILKHTCSSAYSAQLR